MNPRPEPKLIQEMTTDSDQNGGGCRGAVAVRLLLALVLLGILVGFGLLAIWQGTPLSMEEGLLLFERTLDWLRERPLLLFSATAVLPGLGLPVSPFLIALGAVGIPRYGIIPTCIGAFVAIVLCMIWNYWLASSLFRRFFGRLVASKQHLIPRGDTGNFLVFAILFRITPGVPLVVQNYTLGFMRMPFGKYLLVSAATHVVYTPAYVISGGALIEGNWGLLLIAVVVIVLVAALTMLVRQKLEGMRPKGSGSDG